MSTSSSSSSSSSSSRRRRRRIVFIVSKKQLCRVACFFCALLLLFGDATATKGNNGETTTVENNDDDIGATTRDAKRSKIYAEKVKSMFEHAFDGYKTFAFPGDELKPVSKSKTNSLQELGANAGDRKYFDEEYDGVAMSLIESLSTLAVVGNTTEFTKSVDWLSKHWPERLERNHRNMRVNVFEANIRILGGLLSGHVLAGGNVGVRKWSKIMHEEISTSPSFDSVCVGNVGEEGMYKNGEKREYDGSLLQMARTFGEMLLKSFDEDSANKINRKEKKTNLPYGWVNLEHGPVTDKPNTNVAAIGTLALEFGTLSRLTGDKRFEEKAKEAMIDLWSRRNVRTNLLGSIINVETGEWIDSVGGIGANGDSFYEYALKSYVMFGDAEYLEIFLPAYKAVMKYYHKSSGWFTDAEMNTGNDRHHQLTALQKFWPGLQAVIGDVDRARSSQTLMMNVWVKYGMSPERYMITEDILHSTERGYHLRPELSESTSFLYKATRDKRYLRDGRIIVEDLIKHSKVPGGFTSVTDALTKKKGDHMPSYFLSETLKYLYLLFTDFQFFKVDGSSGDNQATSKEVVFTTEGHLLPAYRTCPYIRDEANNIENVVEKRLREVGIRLGFFAKEDIEGEYELSRGSDNNEDEREEGESLLSNFDEPEVQIIEANEDDKRDKTPEEREKARKIREAVLNHIQEQQQRILKKRKDEQKRLEDQQLQEEKAKLELEAFQKSVPYSHQFLYRDDIRKRFKKTKGTDSSCHVLDENTDHSCTMIAECGVDAKSCAQRVCDSHLGSCV